jgi:Tfp pilus assembly protein PilF
MDRHFEHALVLLEQQRFDLAEEKLRQSLLSAPDHGLSHALLAHCLCEREQWDAAADEARQACHLAPELPEAHAAMARVWYERHHYDEALAAIDEALRLDPGNPNHYHRLAAIHLARRDWPAALDAASLGLEMDPQHAGCINLRAMALVKLGRNDDATAAIATALARNPEDAFTHANQGWAYLHEGNHQQALVHFREALRIDPNMDFARAGLVEALKSKNIIYALMLRYFLFMARMSGRVQWIIVLGGYFGYQFLRSLAAQNPRLGPWVRPFIIAYMVFAVLTWISAPLFNFLLRLDPFGKYALSRDQRAASNWIGGLLLLAAIAGGVWLSTDGDFAFVAAAAAIYFGLLLLPVSGTFNCQAGWPRTVMGAYTIGLAFVGPAFVPALYVGQTDLATLCLQAFCWGTLLSGFLANYLSAQVPRR